MLQLTFLVCLGITVSEVTTLWRYTNLFIIIIIIIVLLSTLLASKVLKSLIFFYPDTILLTLQSCLHVGVFCLLFAYAVIVYIQSRLTKAQFRHFFFLAVIGAAGAVFLTVIGLTYTGE